MEVLSAELRCKPTRTVALRGALAARDDRAGVAHALAGRCGRPAMNAATGLVTWLLMNSGGLFLVGPADLADHDDRRRCRGRP
jgi:hypothetical protein